MARPAKPIAVTRWPWDQVALEMHEVSAIKAIAQTHPAGFALILDKIAGVDRISFTAGGEDGRRATDFAEGKRWVATTLRAIATMKMPGPKPQQTGPHAVPVGAPPGET